jgi:hypothetical protein
MAQAGYTPIQLYYSTTASAVPTAGNLNSGELAINITDGKLYYKSNAGVVTLLAGATAGPAGGSNTQVQFNSSGALAGSSNMTFNGTTLTVNDLTDSSLTATRVVYAGASGNLVDSANLTFSGSALAVTGSFSATTTIAAGGAIKSTGANLVNEASAVKLSQEGVSTSTITAYGTNASTQGSLNISLKSSDGSVQSTSATFNATGLGVGVSPTSIFNASFSGGAVSGTHSMGFGIPYAANLQLKSTNAGTSVAVASVGLYSNLERTREFAFFNQADDTRSGYLGYQYVSGSAVNNLTLFNALAGDLIFGTNNGERARFNSSGYLLIGTTAADTSGSACQGPLQVQGPVNGALGADVGPHTFAEFAGAQAGSTQTDWGGGITLKPIFARGSTVFLGVTSQGTNMEGTPNFVIRSGPLQNNTTEIFRINNAGETILSGGYVPSTGSRLFVRGTSAGGYNNTFTATNATVSIVSNEMTDGAWSPTLNIATVRQSLTTGSTSFGGIGFSTVDDSNNSGQYDAGRIAIVNEQTSTVLSATALAFYTQVGGVSNTNASTERMRINSSGFVGIGTTSPVAALQVISSGTAVTTPPGNGGIYIQNNGASAFDAAVYVIAGQSGNARLNCGYSTGASNTSVVAQFFSDNGSTRAVVVAGGSGGVYVSSGGTSWNSLSDERLKDIIEPITNASASLKNWRTVIGKYKTDADGVRRVFFIAQDIQKTTPEAVDSTKEEELGLRYSDTIPVVTAAVNEHTDEIASLKNIIETLKARLDAANL